jgi:hypothetical protein
MESLCEQRGYGTTLDGRRIAIDDLILLCLCMCR